MFLLLFVIIVGLRFCLLFFQDGYSTRSRFFYSGACTRHMYTLTYTLKICAISLAVNINKLFGKVFLTQKTLRKGCIYPSGNFSTHRCLF